MSGPACLLDAPALNAAMDNKSGGVCILPVRASIAVRVRGVELRRFYSPPGTMQRFSLSRVLPWSALKWRWRADTPRLWAADEAFFYPTFSVPSPSSSLTSYRLLIAFQVNPPLRSCRQGRGAAVVEMCSLELRAGVHR